jgi:3-oxoacyl-(acyl-carrier-protein) synthase/3-hydroxymyristoyl/3-hydroxydecanoyl-(acyl carrier protein) dehydratase
VFAVVGLDALLPGCSTAEAWIRRDTSAITDVPAGRWPASPDAGTGPDEVATRRGGFVEGFTFDPAGLAIEAAELDPQLQWFLHVVRGALPPTAPRERTGVVLAALALPTNSHVRAVADTLLSPVGLEIDALSGGRARDRLQGVWPARLATEALGLGGTVDVLDAACASGLYAVALACDRLARGELDCAIAAGVSGADSLYLFLGFTQLRALSRSGNARPLDRRADGLLVGEGAAAVALKRLPDALRDGDRIHAVVRGAGAGSDGRKGNLLAPAEDGQLRALRRAWSRAGLDPATVGLVECHATGTPVGDAVEVRALETLLADRRGAPVVVASSKRWIGHTVTTAGIAGLIRAVGAVRDGVLPAGCDDPRPALAGSRLLRALPAAEPWEGARRAAVSAFGFGGTDAHVVLDAFVDGDPHPVLLPPPPALAVVGWAARVGTASDEGLLDALRVGADLSRPAPPEAVRSGTERGAWIAEVTVDPRRYKIPPLELAELLPQQLLALDLAFDAVARAGPLDPARTAVVFGIEVDGRIAEATVRATLREAGLGPLADAVAAPLVAGRVQGSLPNFVANRIATQLGFEGPSYVVGGGAASGLVALDHAARWLATGDVDAVVVGAVDFACGAGGATEDGGVAFVVRRADGTTGPILATLRPSSDTGAAGAETCGAASALVGVLEQIARAAPGTVAAQGRSWHVEPGEPVPPHTQVWDRILAVPHGGPALPRPAFTGGWGRDSVPVPLPLGDDEIDVPVFWPGGRAAPVALAWESVDPMPMPVPVRGPSADLATSLSRALQAQTDAHARFLDVRSAALDQLATVATALARAAEPRAPELPRPLDRRALLAHATGRLSEAFGPGWADLDGLTPRVRMPAPPLLLVDRVVRLEGERGRFGPSRIVTEYDVPAEATWSADGRPPACVVVESGQADLLLVSWLGIDAELRGRRVYRLLDCDLTFHARRPEPGTTLRHDIGIDGFTTHGGTTLFAFHYDCTDGDGRPVLSMREGRAGFFTPEALASPRGVRPALPPAAPTQVTPFVSGAPASLSERALAALADGRASEALGPAFAAADGARLRLPPSDRWRLLHRVTRLATSGGPHGLGEVVAELDLHDDDWFNRCHFVDDPCLPGTLMLEACLQTVQVWLLAIGAAAVVPDGVFEPLVGRTTRLRCRGQVAPGHHLLTIHARMREASTSGSLSAVADVIVSVDGLEVVTALDVGVQVDGERRAPATIDRARLLELAVGSAARALGSHLAPYDAPGRRLPRTPGPPLVTMSRIEAVEGEPGIVAAPRTVRAAWDVPTDAWFWRADPGAPLPFALLLEAALQPCGWLTAWQGAGTNDGLDVSFRNLGGRATIHADVWPDSGTLVTTATQTSLSANAGMQIERFAVEVRCGDQLAFTGHTEFGYFSRAALAAQKGVTVGPPLDLAPVDTPLDHPRRDLRLLDRLIGAGHGALRAETAIDPDAWWFVAHFRDDPVMPGSLGLEALLQLARVLRPGDGPRSIAHGREVTWTYRGQVLPSTRSFTTEIQETDDGLRGVLRADGVPIYLFEHFALAPARRPLAVARTARGDTPLLDAVTVDGNTAIASLRLDPTVQPWLHDHRPTRAAAAVPLAFLAEIAAEVAVALRRGRLVVGIPQLRAERWITAPAELHVTAVADADLVAVTFGVDGVAHARAVVRVGDAYTPGPPPARIDPVDEGIDGRAWFDSGHTFHGPSLQGLVRLDRSGAVLTTRDDGAALGASGRFVLDPVLLDNATHPMRSDEPERWVVGLPPGRLAYPVLLEDLRLHGPRPQGEVRCVITLVSGTDRKLVFDVALHVGDVPWCTFRWTEAVVAAGVILGHPAAERRRFSWDREDVPSVTVGRPTEAGWEVRAGDLLEPLPGTTAAAVVSPGELAERATAADPAAWDRGRIAAHEAVRHWLRSHHGVGVHPATVEIVELRAGVCVITDSSSLTATELTRWLHPTVVWVRVTDDGRRACAEVVPPSS